VTAALEFKLKLELQLKLAETVLGVPILPQ